VTTSVATSYERTSATARLAQLRSREVQLRRRTLNLGELHELLGDLDCAITAVGQAGDDEQLSAERLLEAAACKEAVDRLWRRTLAASLRALRAGAFPPSGPRLTVQRRAVTRAEVEERMAELDRKAAPSPG
jgi:hypothetical protein